MNAVDAKTNETNKERKSGSAVWALGLLLLTKGQTMLLGLMKIKGVACVITMIINILAYWWTGKLGLPAAAGFVGLIFVHEMGHVFALRHYKVDATSPFFIPFVGAFVGLKERPANAYQEAVIAIAGPILGSAGAAVCFVAYLLTGAKVWLWLFAMGVLLNLFNLIPASPLDGGRVVGCVWRGTWMFGIALLLSLAVMQRDAYYLCISVICLSEIHREVIKSKRALMFAWSGLAVAITIITAVIGQWLGLFATLLCLLFLSLNYHSRVTLDEESRESIEAYRKTSTPQRIIMSTAYLSLCGILGGALYWVNLIGAFKIAH